MYWYFAFTIFFFSTREEDTGPLYLWKIMRKNFAHVYIDFLFFIFLDMHRKNHIVGKISTVDPVSGSHLVIICVYFWTLPSEYSSSRALTDNPFVSSSCGWRALQHESWGHYQIYSNCSDYGDGHPYLYRGPIFQEEQFCSFQDHHDFVPHSNYA